MIALDTNIYVSAFQFGRKPMELLEMAARGEVEVAVSQPIVEGTIRVLRDKFSFPDAKLLEARTTIEVCGTMVTQQKNRRVKEDPPDNRILECAVESGSGWIVSGDKDLLGMGEFQGIRIVRLSEFPAWRQGAMSDS